MSASTGPAWRFSLGIVCFIAAFAIHLVTLAAIAVGASAAMVGSIAAINFAVNKGLLVVAAAIMGRPGFNRLKQLVFGAVRRYARPDEISPMRYRVGLILFVVPIFFGWVSPYLPNIVPALNRHTVSAAVLGDAMLLISLFVLGGGFWDKLRALFVRDAYVISSDQYFRYFSDRDPGGI